MNIMSADQFIAQGTSPAQISAIAAYYEMMAENKRTTKKEAAEYMKQAARVRNIAKKVKESASGGKAIH